MIHQNVNVVRLSKTQKDDVFTIIAIKRLESLPYASTDVRARENPEEFLQQVIANGRNAGTITTEPAQVITAYNHFDRTSGSAMRDIRFLT